MILGEDGQKLSKRHGAASVMDYREQGFIPEALLNYLVRLGWSHGDQEVFTRDEMIRLFDVADVNNSASALNSGKLLWLNQHYFKTLDPAHVAHHLSYHLGKLDIDPSTGPDPAEVASAYRERAKTLVEMAQSSVFFYKEFDAYEEKAAKKNLKAEVVAPLSELRERFAGLGEWNDAAIHQALNEVAEKHGLQLGKLAQPLRVAVTGAGVSPPIDVTVRLIGKERVVARMARGIEYAQKNAG
jgi:glutamyl-tRNA synthetase